MKAVLTSHPRIRLWLVYFLFILTMSTGLSLITPHYGGPDESNHLIYLYDVFDGDVPMNNDVQDVPAWIKDADPKCWAFNMKQSAHCAGEVDVSDTSFIERSTSAANYPPFYYLLIGWPIKFLSGSAALRAIRFLSAILFSALAALGLSFLRTNTTRHRTDLLALIAITPSAYVLGGFLQPQALEIGAAIALAGILLPLSHTPEETNIRLKWAIPITFLLVISRTTGMWWALMICLLILLTLGKKNILTLIKNRLLWIYVATSALWCVLSLGWTFVTKDWYEFHSNHVTSGACEVFDCILPNALEGYQFNFMTAVTGYLDTWPPEFCVYLYWAAIAAMVIIALIINVKKTLATTVFVDVVYLVSCVALSVSWVDYYGGPIWQGRYALPLVIPYLIAIASIFSQSQKIPAPLYRWFTRLSLSTLSLLFFFFALSATLRFWSGIGNGIDILHGPLYAPTHAQIGLALCTVASVALCAGIWYTTRLTRALQDSCQTPENTNDTDTGTDTDLPTQESSTNKVPIK